MKSGEVLIPGSKLIENWILDTKGLFDNLISLDYDKSMKSRWTASFGKSYDYSGKTYPYSPIPKFLDDLIPKMTSLIGFEPNNCLINLYHNGDSTMGYHSDNTDILLPGTGVLIISIGSERVLRFKNKIDKENTIDYVMRDGSLFYMDDSVQDNWLHSIPKSDTNDIRISLTFRYIR